MNFKWQASVIDFCRLREGVKELESLEYIFSVALNSDALTD